MHGFVCLLDLKASHRSSIVDAACRQCVQELEIADEGWTMILGGRFGCCGALKRSESFYSLFINLRSIKIHDPTRRKLTGH
jgi:hypothetical protein